MEYRALMFHIIEKCPLGAFLILAKMLVLKDGFKNGCDDTGKLNFNDLSKFIL